MVYEACDALEMQAKLFWKMVDVASLVVVAQIVYVQRRSKIMMTCHYTASIIAHYSMYLLASLSDISVR